MDYLIDDSDQLKLCPFCGAVAEIVTLEGEDGDVGIGAQCVQCTACGSASGLIYPLMDDVTNLLYERWNRRQNGIKMEWQPIEIEQLQAKVAELAADVERLKALSVTNIMVNVVPGWDGNGEEVYAKSVEDVENLLTKLSEKADDFDLVTSPLRQQLAAEQLNNKRLRKALEAVIKVHGYESGIPVEAISTQASTEALDKYVAEKVKDAESRTGNQSPCYTIARDMAVRMWEKHYKTDAPNWEPLDDFMGVLSQISNMLPGLGNVEKITKQRDLTVEALENCRLLAARHRKEEWAGHIMRFCKDAGLSGSPIRNDSIKESEAK